MYDFSSGVLNYEETHETLQIQDRGIKSKFHFQIQIVAGKEGMGELPW